VNFLPHHLSVLAQRLPASLPPAETGLRLAATTVNALLVIALAHALAGLTLTILTGEPTMLNRLAPAAGPVMAQNATARPAVDVAAISAWHLFGKVEANRPPPPPVAIPVTPLNLRLGGTFFVEQGGARALALIADGNSLERGYRPGEALPGGARLERIERDQVVVSRNGREEALKLPKLDDPNRPVMTPSLPVLPEPVPGPETAAFSEPQMIDASAIAERMRGEAASRPQVLEDIAFASPYVQNGQFVGFRLRPGRDRQLFQQLGLNGGDVLTEINGTRLSSPAQGLAILQELMSASRIDVRVLRNGAEVPLTFTLDGS
jgi:general secretion pathway protein C